MQAADFGARRSFKDKLVVCLRLAYGMHVFILNYALISKEVGKPSARPLERWESR